MYNCDVEIIEFENMYKRPERKRLGDCGYDVYSAVDIVVPAHAKEATRVDLGFGVKLPEGVVCYLHNRSGTFKRGLIVSDALVDYNYSGSIGAYLINTTDEDIEIKRGERPASLLFTSAYGVNFLSAEEAQAKQEAFEGSRGDARENSSGR
jgi:dUTPase